MSDKIGDGTRVAVRDGYPDPGYLIGARELRGRFDAVTLLDLRPAEDFAVGHIPGSRHRVPLTT
jgi:hypothetical protein